MASPEESPTLREAISASSSPPITLIEPTIESPRTTDSPFLPSPSLPTESPPTLPWHIRLMRLNYISLAVSYRELHNKFLELEQANTQLAAENSRLRARLQLQTDLVRELSSQFETIHAQPSPSPPSTPQSSTTTDEAMSEEAYARMIPPIHVRRFFEKYGDAEDLEDLDGGPSGERYWKLETAADRPENAY